MASYTGGGETVDLTTSLPSVTVADIEKTGEDAYAKYLNVSQGVEIDELQLLAGGTANIRSGAHIDSAHLQNDFGATALLQISSGGVVVSADTTGTTGLYVSAGGTLTNMTANPDCYVNVYGRTGEIDGGTFKGKRLQVNGIVKNVIIYTNLADSLTQVRASGTLSNCTIVGGASFRVSGGQAVGTLVSGAGATFRVSTGKANDTTVLSGGKMYVSGGTVNGITAMSGAMIYISKATVASNVLISGIGTYSSGGSSAVNRATLHLQGGTISGLTMSGGSLYTANNTSAKNIYNVDITNDNNGKAATDNHIDYAVVNISSGAVISGGSVHDRAQFNARSATIIDVDFGKNTWNNMYTAVTMSGGTVFGGELRLALASGGVDCTDILVSETVVNGGALHARCKTGLVKDATVIKGDICLSGGETENTTLSGGTLNMLSAGVINRNATVSGGTVNQLNGETIDAKVFSGGAINLSGGVINGAIVSGGDLKFINTADAKTVYDLTLVNQGAKYGNVSLTSNAALSRGFVSSGLVGIYSGAVVKDVDYAKGTYINLHGGAISGGTATNGASLRIHSDGGVNIVNGTVITDNAFLLDYSFREEAGVGGTATDLTFTNGAGYHHGATWKWTAGGSNYSQYYDGGYASNLSFDTGAVMVASGGELVTDVRFANGANMTLFGGTVESAVFNAGGTATVAGGILNSVTINDDGFVKLGSGAKINDTTVNSGGYLEAAGSAKQAAITDLTVLSGGKFLLTANSASVTGFAAEAGAVISLSFTNATAATAAAFDTLADCDATIRLLNVGTATKTFNVATTGNNNQQFAMLGSGVFEGSFKAGDVYVDPFTQQQLTVAADATTVSVVQYNRTTVTEAATFATSGATINGGDKELMWDGATVTGAVKLLDADAAAAINGDVWMDIRACAAGSDAAIYGTDVNVNFAGKVQYQLHGTGDTVGNLAAGANYGGSVKGVDILTYNTTYTGVGYAGGFGTVQNEVEVLFAGGNTLNKDFYGGALYNAGKVAPSTTTSVGNVKMTIGEKSTDAISVKGNVYGASAVKAGTITTVENQAPLHTVGDVELTLRAGTATKNYQACVFAGGYATGHDTAKLAAVYTVTGVTANITGGDWGSACGGRGVFGGAFASDNLFDGTEAAGVYAKVGDVNLTISGGTMGNVYGGGWAQKGAKSEVGNVNLTVKGGTIGNIFGGGSHSTSGGSTVAGDITISVSGGTISGDIFARGQLDGDTTETANVIFSGAKNFSCGVYGYSYVGGAASDAVLSFNGYTGTFSGKVGGFNGIAFNDGTAMTLTTAAADVSNSKWEFDLSARAEALAGTSLLTWSSAEFTGDTVKVNFADAVQAAAGWSIAAANFTGATFDLWINGSEITSVAYDTEIADGDWAGWKFTNVGGTLKFANLA